MAQSVSVNFRANTTHFSKGIGTLKKGISSVRGAIGGLMGGIAGVGIGIAGLGLYFNKFRQDMDRIDKLSKSFGDSTDSLQRIALAAELSGANLEQVVKAMSKLNVAATEASRGTLTYKRAMDELGLSGKDILNKNFYERLIELGDAYQRAGNKARAQANLQQILGRSGRELIPLIKDMANADSGLRNVTDNMNVVSGDVIQRMVEFNDNLAVMRQNLQVLFSNLVGNIADAALFLQTAMDMGELGEIVKTSFLYAGAAVINQMARGFLAIGTALSTVVANSADLAMHAADFVTSNIGGIGKLLLALFKNFFADLGYYITMAMEKLGNIFGVKSTPEYLAQVQKGKDEADAETFAAFDDLQPHFDKMWHSWQNDRKDVVRTVLAELKKNENVELIDTSGLQSTLDGALSRVEAEAEKRRKLMEGLRDSLKNQESDKVAQKKTADTFKPVVSSLQRIGGASGLTAVTFNPMVREQKRTNQYLDGIQEALNEKPNMRLQLAWQ